jgi:cytoskeletal protein RodZ
MNKVKNSTKLIATIVSLAVTILLVIVLVFWLRGSDVDEEVADTATASSETTTEPQATTEPDVDATADESVAAAPEAEIDRTNISTIDITPLDISVAYVKGIPGFEFFVQRATNGTQYVEFSSEDLKGTKCTDDQGIFATIVKNPSEIEAQSLTATQKVGVDTYGLSLSEATCTSDAELLDRYQTSFAEAFSLIEAITEES